uniref:E3 ubiquitin-protein ligase UNKL n=1 Tax=Macrostomum lignano TaxID=282301 RepID=A0A1I8IHU2_9PLAT
MSSVSPVPQTPVSSLTSLIINTNIARLSPVMNTVTQSLQGVALPVELDLAPQGIGMPQVYVKPQHLTYLRDFRTQQCPLFANHKCSQHKPFTCFHWHFPNQRRRRPLRKPDGTFSYSPDVYCDKYDETRGECPNGDACPYLHRNAGDTERRYHLRYFKTGTCIHDTDTRGQCSRNGTHCAFAHGATDLRVPVYDIREVQEASDCPVNLPASLEKERVLSEDPKWNDMGYVLANYKTEPCRKPPRMCRQGYACPFYHNAKDKRRQPHRFKYRSTPCPTVKSSDEWSDSSICEAGEECQFCHTRTEQQFHPEIYKSTKCNDIMQQHYCPRGPFCAFAHDEAEMNFGRNFMQDIELQGLLSAVAMQHQQQQQSSPVINPITMGQLVSPTVWERSITTAIKGRTTSGLSSTSLESGLGSWRHCDSPSTAVNFADESSTTAAAAAAAAAAATSALLPDFGEFDLSQDSSSAAAVSACSPLTVQTGLPGGGQQQQQEESPSLQSLFETEARHRAGSASGRQQPHQQLPVSRRRQTSNSEAGGGCNYAQSPILMSESPFSNAGLELERLRYECEIERANEEAQRAKEAAQRANRERASAEAELRRLCAGVKEAALIAETMNSEASEGVDGGRAAAIEQWDAFRSSLQALLQLEAATELPTLGESSKTVSGGKDQIPVGTAEQQPVLSTKFCFSRENEPGLRRLEEKR